LKVEEKRRLLCMLINSILVEGFPKKEKVTPKIVIGGEGLI
jgi:molybdopterin-guanine dinucleotide biosynthesis protein